MDEHKKKYMGSWAIGGGLLMGLGAGFFFLEESALYFVGCIIAGLGLGLLIAALAPREKS
jgi:hypothetical protein